MTFAEYLISFLAELQLLSFNAGIPVARRFRQHARDRSSGSMIVLVVRMTLIVLGDVTAIICLAIYRILIKGTCKRLKIS